MAYAKCFDLLKKGKQFCCCNMIIQEKKKASKQEIQKSSMGRISLAVFCCFCLFTSFIFVFLIEFRVPFSWVTSIHLSDKVSPGNWKVYFYQKCRQFRENFPCKKETVLPKDQKSILKPGRKKSRQATT